MANTCKEATKFGSMIGNELISLKIFDINATTSTIMKTMRMGYLVFVQGTIKKQSEETMWMTKENVKQVIIVENEA